MILTAFHGFCMALADSVPGVSGGTIAFILGFYDRFINALHDLFQGNRTKRMTALRYLAKLGVGWCIGMGACVMLLSSLFEQHIYFMSLLFLGLTVCSIRAIRTALQKHRGAMVWLILGLMLGSLYAITYGPTSLDAPLPPLSPATFQLPAFLLGAVLLLGLELLKRILEKPGAQISHIQKGETNA